MKISFGNLSQNVTEEELTKLFSEYGEVKALVIKKDKKTGTSLGFGHLEMDDSGAHKAIHALNGKEFAGKPLAVVDANELQSEQDSKQKSKAQGSTGKIHGGKAAGGFGGTGSTVRRTGGGGRGK
jgi:cold-inducible RNA-binding protein